jgi:hypothetical protein
MSIFWNSSEYDKCKAEGMSEDQIFEKLMSSAVTIEIYPMWSDPQDKNKYKLFDFDSYLHLKERRAKAVVREIERTADELKLAKKGLPQLEARYKRPQLQSDGIVFELPPAPVHCPYSGCSQLFKSDAELVDHIQKTHVTSKKLFTCPVCLSGELREMEHGDFKCSECRSIIDKEQMKKYLGK